MKKFLSVLCMLLLTFSACLPMLALAEDAVVIEIGDATCRPGEEITLDVRIESNPGMCYLCLTPVCYDSQNNRVSDLTIRVTNGSLFSLTSGINAIWDADQDVADVGLLCTLSVTVPEDMPVGIYTISFIPRECYNYNEEDVAVELRAGTITVEEEYLLMGDVDFSGVVDVADIMKLKDMILQENWNDAELKTGDLNHNQLLEVADIISIKNIIMNNIY